jgi:4-hydroxybenzoate polyprenyltransferase
MIAYLEILRVANLPTAMAGVLLGFFWATTDLSPANLVQLALVLCVSSMLYLAGMVLNDLYDIETDRLQRPNRPLPSGRIGYRTAWRLGWGLLCSGVGLAIFGSLAIGNVRIGLIACLLALAVVLYDRWLKSTWLAPPMMGACRALNILLGMSVATIPWDPSCWLIAGAIGLYITGVTLFARKEAIGGNRVRLVGGIVLMVAGILILAHLPELRSISISPDRWRLFIVVLATLVAMQCRRAIFEPIPQRIQQAVRASLFSLVLIDASVVVALRSPGYGLVVLSLLVPSIILSRWIPSS